ncbi:MAG: hypothetical protein JST86_13530 [Bacteroidetes bacterium]|nr:hypothetical protein [Bacteroidota bacterium]
MGTQMTRMILMNTDFSLYHCAAVSKRKIAADAQMNGTLMMQMGMINTDFSLRLSVK